MHPDRQVENKILKIIKQQRKFNRTFEEIIKGFDKKLSDFKPLDNCFDIETYFGSGIGQAGATKKLLADKRIQSDWLRDYHTKKENKKNDFKGLYVFFHKDTPFYVGISKGVIARIFQHTKGHSHNTSTLAYNIGLVRYEIINGKPYLGDRKDLNFATEVAPVKEFLMKQKIALIKIDDNEELYLFELYVSMKLQTWLNKFETH